MDFVQKPIRVVHFCYWFFLVLPAWIEFVYPGYTRLDEVLNLETLPGKIPVLVLGIILFLIGMYYGLASSQLLAKIGRGAMAFKFSKNVVVSGVYDQLRNPMALGYYLMILGVGLMAHSTYFFFLNLFIIIPSHIFYIKYFEEFEVELRLGKSYIEYKQQTPFLIPKVFVKLTNRNKTL
ncbi:methyltransferase family protein [Desulfitobacterium metallireducens]|nr:methyltransferase [Desulfitobacterium metallireducens]